MNTKEFIDRVKCIIEEEIRHETAHEYKVELVWFNYTLGNMKALLVTLSPDQYYYEATYSREKEQLYVDKYEKLKHEMYL